MRQINVTELKNKLSQYLRLVKRGETIEILERSVPVARLQGMEHTADRGDAHLERLRRDGIVSVAREPPGMHLLGEEPVSCLSDPVRALVEGRGDR